MSDQSPLPEPTPASNRNRRSFQRRRPRGKVKVACYKGALDLGENIALGLADVSESGVRLQVKRELERGQEVVLAIEGREHMRPIKSRGRVVWSTPGADGTFQIGIQLDSYFLYRDIAKMT